MVVLKTHQMELVSGEGYTPDYKRTVSKMDYLDNMKKSFTLAINNYAKM